MMVASMEHTTLIVGVPSTTVWSLASTLTRTDAMLSLTMTVTAATQDPAMIGREVLHTLQDWFEHKAAQDDVASFFAKLSLPDGVQVSLWYQDPTLSLFTVSHGGVGVIRQGAYFPILQGQSGVKSVQGKLLADDIVVFGTDRFWEMYPPKLASSGEPMRLAQSLATAEQSQSDPTVCGQVSVYRPASSQIAAPVDSVVVTPEVKEARQVSLPKLPQIWVQFGPQTKKIAIGVFAIVVVIGGLLALQQFSLGSRQRRIDAVLKPLESRFTEIVASGDARVSKEKNIAELLQDAQNAGKNSSNDIAIRSKLDELTGRIHQKYLEIAQRTELDHLSVFYDFRLITADFVASAVQYDEPGKLAVFLDTNHNKIVSLALEKKQPQSLSLTSDIGTLASLSIADRKAYVLGTKGIYEASLPLDTQGKQVASASSDWVSPSLIGSFGSNLYIFDAQARQVFRYDRSDLSASPAAWLKSKEGVELEKISSLSIDGDLWMGTSIGQIYKFTRGDRVPFRLSDILITPEGAIALYTSESAQHLYVLEPRAERLLVFDKSGKYMRTIACPDLAAATSFVVDETGKRVYILAGSLVYVLEL